MFLVVVGLVGCKETLVHDVEEFEANNIRLSLVRAGIAATKHSANGKWSISVEEADVKEALSLLGDTRLLQKSTTSDFSKTSFLSSKEERHLQINNSISSSLEETIETLPGVDEARVHLFQGETSRWQLTSNDKSTKSASVLVLTHKQVPYLKQNVARIVAGAVGIAVEGVRVVVEHRTYGVDDLEVPDAPVILAVAPQSGGKLYPVQVVDADPKIESSAIEEPDTKNSNFGKLLLGLVVSGTAILGHKSFSRDRLLRPK